MIVCLSTGIQWMDVIGWMHYLRLLNSSLLLAAFIYSIRGAGFIFALPCVGTFNSKYDWLRFRSVFVYSEKRSERHCNSQRRKTIHVQRVRRRLQRPECFVKAQERSSWETTPVQMWHLREKVQSGNLENHIRRTFRVFFLRCFFFGLWYPEKSYWR